MAIVHFRPIRISQPQMPALYAGCAPRMLVSSKGGPWPPWRLTARATFIMPIFSIIESSVTTIHLQTTQLQTMYGGSQISLNRGVTREEAMANLITVASVLLRRLDMEVFR